MRLASRNFILLVTLLIGVCLTAYGMRMLPLKRSGKPKPRPRAVLKLYGKQLTSSSITPKSKHDKQPVILTVPAVCTTTAPADAPLAQHPLAAAASRQTHPSGGRAPPLA